MKKKNLVWLESVKETDFVVIIAGHNPKSVDEWKEMLLSVSSNTLKKFEFQAVPTAIVQTSSTGRRPYLALL